MKYTDDYQAKFRIWAREAKVYPVPTPVNLPRFSPKKFDTWEAFNAWKKSYLKRIARQGGVKWTR